MFWKCLSRRVFVGLKSRLKKRGKLVTKLEYQRKQKWKENSIKRSSEAYNFLRQCLFYYVLIHCTKKWSIPLRVSWVNVTKSAGNCGFYHIYGINQWWKTSFLTRTFGDTHRLMYKCWTRLFIYLSSNISFFQINPSGKVL